MKRTLAAILSACSVAMASPSSVATPGSLAEGPTSATGGVSADALEVRGVRIGTPRSNVLSSLGAPRSSTSGRDRELGLGRWQKLNYGGLTVEVALPEPGYLQSQRDEPYAWRIIVTSGRWASKSGLRVGQSLTEVVGKLGPPDSQESKAGETILRYHTRPFDGFFWVRARSDRVFEIGISEDWT